MTLPTMVQCRYARILFAPLALRTHLSTASGSHLPWNLHEHLCTLISLLLCLCDLFRRLALGFQSASAGLGRHVHVTIHRM